MLSRCRASAPLARVWAALNARRTTLAILGEVDSVPVAEHAMSLLLACLQRLRQAEAALRKPGRWDWPNRLEAAEAGASAS